jgi:hypothetical protein
MAITVILNIFELDKALECGAGTSLNISKYDSFDYERQNKLE